MLKEGAHIEPPVLFFVLLMQKQETDIGQFNAPVKQPWPSYIRQEIVLGKAEAQIVVAFGGVVVVAIGTADVGCIIVPTAAPYHAIGTASVRSLILIENLWQKYTYLDSLSKRI